MISCNLEGGLGNYMFQIATTHSISVDYNDVMVIDDTNVHAVHKHINTYKSNIFRNIHFGSVSTENNYGEPQFHYSKIPYSPNLRLNGYYQSEKYFKHNRDKLLKLFSIDETTNNYITTKYGNNFNNTCSVHVRRGDYLRYPNHHPFCGIEYYEKSMYTMGNSYEFLIFSDDIEWCKENFSRLPYNFKYIEGNPDYVDLYLMSMCENNIIANSSFSWWGSWLNTNDLKLVISPKVWFGSSSPHNDCDIIPFEWTRI